MALALVLVLGVQALPGAAPNPAPPEDGRNKQFSYRNEKVLSVPWSIHVVKLDRSSQEYELDTLLAKQAVVGMETLADQVKGFRSEVYRPVAAVNGDFYRTGNAYEGDPEGLQICHGELVSGPSGKACFWMDAENIPHTAEVQSLFRVTWPDGTGTPFGLNEERGRDAAVLFTPTFGPSTHTSGGREYVLEPTDPHEWLPLRVCSRMKARVKEVREAGNTPLRPGLMVLSLAPKVAEKSPALRVGDTIDLSTATAPDLTGCRAAIGGGPRLVVDGKPVGGWKSPNQRHPRAAIGWNAESIFIILADGRQPGLSMGMSFTEMADYFIRLGCTHAMNLDGGGSASMWLLGQTVSSPSEGRERPIANGLVVVKKVRDPASVND